LRILVIEDEEKMADLLESGLREEGHSVLVANTAAAPMKFGIRIPSFQKRIAARLSSPRFIRHSLGFKAPRGFGWFTNPRRAAYNRIYNRTTIKADNVIVLVIVALVWLLSAVFGGIASLFSNKTPPIALTTLQCPRCGSPMVLRSGRRGAFYGCSRFPRCRGSRNYSR
jgi:hypothetical protein